MRPDRGKSPYKKISQNGSSVGEHRAVWEEANGPIPPGFLVHHKNENTRDNRLDNLELLSHAEHSRHHNDRYPRTKACEACGREYEPLPTKRKRSKACSPTCRAALIAKSRLGAKNPKARLDAQAVIRIREACARGEMQKDVAVRFGIHKGTVSAIIRGESWSHV